MKTSTYTFVVWDEGAMAAGSDCAAQGRRTALIPRREKKRLGGDNVIDLNAWRAADPDPLWEDPGREEDACRAEDEPLPAPRTRRDHGRTLMAAELLSTLAVAGAALAIILRMLAF